MKRLPNGVFDGLAKRTGFAPTYLGDLIGARKRPGRKRAVFLENAAREAGLNIPAALWLLGSREELRAALLEDNPKRVCQ